MEVNLVPIVSFPVWRSLIWHELVHESGLGAHNQSAGLRFKEAVPGRPNGI